jgi:hypothetical protein
MVNLEMVRWLEMIWDALAEEDSTRRESKLQTAKVFLGKRAARATSGKSVSSTRKPTRLSPRLCLSTRHDD